MGVRTFPHQSPHRELTTTTIMQCQEAYITQKEQQKQHQQIPTKLYSCTCNNKMMMKFI